jgi:hypothetical protein
MEAFRQEDGVSGGNTASAQASWGAGVVRPYGERLGGSDEHRDVM